MKKEIKKILSSHEILNFSPCYLTYHLMLSGLETEFNKLIDESLELASILGEKKVEEKEAIEAAKTPEEISNLFRKPIKGSVQEFLFEKAFTMETELEILLFKRIINNQNGHFTDSFVRFIYRSERDYINRILEVYPLVVDPMVKGYLCLLLGMKGEVDLVPMLIEEFYSLSQVETEINHPEQGALIGLNELYGRFYEKKKR